MKTRPAIGEWKFRLRVYRYASCSETAHTETLLQSTENGYWNTRRDDHFSVVYGNEAVSNKDVFLSLRVAEECVDLLVNRTVC